MGSKPNWPLGYEPSATEWNAEFASKQDDLGFTISATIAIAGGTSSVAVGASSWSLGYYNALSGLNSSSMGASKAADFGRYGIDVWAGDPNAAVGERQVAKAAWGAETTDAAPVRLTANGAAAGIYNVFNIPDDAAFAFTVRVVGLEIGAQNVKVWTFNDVIMSRLAGVASVLVTAPSAVTSTQGSPGAWLAAVTADTTNGGVNITVTGAAEKIIQWTASIQSTETS